MNAPKDIDKGGKLLRHRIHRLEVLIARGAPLRRIRRASQKVYAKLLSRGTHAPDAQARLARIAMPVMKRIAARQGKGVVIPAMGAIP